MGVCRARLGEQGAYQLLGNACELGRADLRGAQGAPLAGQLALAPKDGREPLAHAAHVVLPRAQVLRAQPGKLARQPLGRLARGLGRPQAARLDALLRPADEGLVFQDGEHGLAYLGVLSLSGPALDAFPERPHRGVQARELVGGVAGHVLLAISGLRQAIDRAGEKALLGDAAAQGSHRALL